MALTGRERPVARLVSVLGEAADEGRLGELVRAGLARAPESPLPSDFLTRELPPEPDGQSLEVLLEERQGR